MFRGLIFPLILLFWITMNILLWRAEYGARMPGGSPVSHELVWNRILTAPDDSALAIIQEGRKIGYCRWTPQIHEHSSEQLGGEAAIEGMVKEPLGYSIRIEGHVILEETGRVRFNLDKSFNPDHQWKTFAFRATFQGASYRLEGSAADESLLVAVEMESYNWERTFKLSDLREPSALLHEFGFPLPLAMIPGLGLNAPANLSLGLNWESRSDWIRIGGTNVRIYRLEARLLDRYQFRAYISRVGEIIRVELPNEVVLLNENLFP
jgi:hypothetical protein